MHRFLTQSILLLSLIMITPAGLALAQDADAPVEPPATLPAASDSQPSTPTESEHLSDIAWQAAQAKVIAELVRQTMELAVGDAGSVSDLFQNAMPSLLAAVIADPASHLQRLIGTDRSIAPAIAHRDDVIRWLTYAQENTPTDETLKSLSVSQVKVDSYLGAEAPAEMTVPQALQPAPLVTDDAKKIPEPALWKKHVVGQGRLLAERAARADALHRLAQRAREIAINDSLTVESFIANSDQPDVDVRQFLRGAKTLGLRCREDALIFEVVLQGSRRTMLASFTGWADSHYKGEPADLVALRKAVEEGVDRLFPETGSAMPPKETIRGIEPETLVRLQAVTGEAVPAWATAEYRAQADGTTPVSADLERQTLTKLLSQAWAAKPPGGDAEQTLGKLAAENETVLYALVLAALMREQDVKRDPAVNETTVRATMPMLPTWRIIARHVLDEGLLPGMTP